MSLNNPHDTPQTRPHATFIMSHNGNNNGNNGNNEEEKGHPAAAVGEHSGAAGRYAARQHIPSLPFNGDKADYKGWAMLFQAWAHERDVSDVLAQPLSQSSASVIDRSDDVANPEDEDEDGSAITGLEPTDENRRRANFVYLVLLSNLKSRELLQQVAGALHAHHTGCAASAELTGNSAAFWILGQHHEGQQETHQENEDDERSVHEGLKKEAAYYAVGRKD